MLLDFTIADPAARDAYLGEKLRGLYRGEPRRGPRTGGRRAGLRLLHEYDATRYGRERNHLDAPVSRLSPYLRHGFLSPIEVRDHLREKYRGQPAVIEEFLRQLAWRDFFEHVLDHHGTAVFDDLEEPKHAVPRAAAIPLNVVNAATGLPCVDGMLRNLFDTGYLHNHERLWFAAYLCHFRGVAWQRGAALFRQYLYDGDAAANSCSWQWVDSTFAAKPYFMNKDNIRQFSGGRWCDTCAAACPFDASYEALQARLFGGNAAPLKLGVTAPESPGTAVPGTAGHPTNTNTVVWVHDAAVRVDDIALRTAPDAAAVFVFDAESLADEPWAFHRLAFLFDGVCELMRSLPHPVKQVRAGPLLAQLRDTGAAEFVLTDHPNPWVRGAVEELQRDRRVRVLPRPKLAEYRDEPKRFTRYWERCAPQVLGYAPAKKGKLHR